MRPGKKGGGGGLRPGKRGGGGIETWQKGVEELRPGERGLLKTKEINHTETNEIR